MVPPYEEGKCRPGERRGNVHADLFPEFIFIFKIDVLLHRGWGVGVATKMAIAPHTNTYEASLSSVLVSLYSSTFSIPGEEEEFRTTIITEFGICSEDRLRYARFPTGSVVPESPFYDSNYSMAIQDNLRYIWRISIIQARKNSMGTCVLSWRHHLCHVRQRLETTSDFNWRRREWEKEEVLKKKVKLWKKKYYY